MAARSKKSKQRRTRSEQWRSEAAGAAPFADGGHTADPSPSAATGTMPTSAPDDVPRPSLRDLAAAPAAAEPTGPRHPGTRFALLLLATVIVAAGTIQMGAPVLGHDWDLGWLIPGALLTALLGWWTWWASGWVSRRRVTLAVIAAGAVLALFTAGAATSVVVDGTPQLAGSPTARAYTMSRQMRDDLVRMSELDELLGLDATNAGVRAAEFDPAAEEMAEIALRYTDRDDLVSERFAATADLMQSAAQSGATALEQRKQSILTPDTTIEAQANQARTQFVTAWSQASESLRAAADEYGVDPGPADEGIRE